MKSVRFRPVRREYKVTDTVKVAFDGVELDDTSPVTVMLVYRIRPGAHPVKVKMAFATDPKTTYKDIKGGINFRPMDYRGAGFYTVMLVGLLNDGGTLTPVTYRGTTIRAT